MKKVNNEGVASIYIKVTESNYCAEKKRIDYLLGDITYSVKDNTLLLYTATKKSIYTSDDLCHDVYVYLKNKISIFNELETKTGVNLIVEFDFYHGDDSCIGINFSAKFINVLDSVRASVVIKQFFPTTIEREKFDNLQTLGYVYLDVVSEYLDFNIIENYLELEATYSKKQNKANSDRWNYECKKKKLEDTLTMCKWVYHHFCNKNYELNRIRKLFDAKITIEFVLYHKTNSRVGFVFDKQFIQFVNAINADIDIDQYCP